MFGNLFGDMEQRQQELQEKLSKIMIDAEVQNGDIRVTATATGVIANIHINPTIIDPDDPEQLEDLLLVAVNKALELASEKQAAETEQLIQGMLPPGLGDMFK